MTDIDKAGRDNILGCFRSTSKKLLKRKHKDSDTKPDWSEKRPTFNNPLFSQAVLGEANHDSWNSPKSSGTASRFEEEAPARKRVKFDEENLICSSITYQRNQASASSTPKSESLLTKFINFTASLF
jgi:hypothetical protein